MEKYVSLFRPTHCQPDEEGTHTTLEQAMLNLKTTYAIERGVAIGQAVWLD
jgi:hypothetical protein